MNLKDSSAKIFFENRKHTAELFNLGFCNGKSVFHEEDLLEISPAQYKIVRNNKEELTTSNRHRDLLFLSKRLTNGKPGKMIIGIEFQSCEDKTMPLRMYEYNLRQYTMQRNMHLDDEHGNLLPVAGIVVNMGMKKWHTNEDLYQMFSEKPSELLPGVDNPRIWLVDTYDINPSILQNCNDELCFVLSCFICHDDANKLTKLIKKYANKGVISAEAGHVLETHLNIRLKEEVTSEGVLMCKGWDELTKGIEEKAKIKWEKIGKAEGIKEGKAEGIKKGKAEGIKKGEIKGMKKGKAEGIKEGKAEGIKEGKAEGIKEGKAEGQKKLMVSIIANAIKNDFDIEALKALTGFSSKQMKQLAIENSITWPYESEHAK